MQTISDNLPIVLGAVLVVVGLLVYGLRDLRRFSVVRTLAVSSLTFREGVRRRVLWTVPLAMLASLGMIVLADPGDERQAIAQAVRSLLFASGLMAVVVPLILGCTNFPREIENRVLYGVVTKPVTRLELLLGKVVGLARLSGVVLIAMGLFSAIVLYVVEARLLARATAQLDAALVDENRRPYLQHLVDDGLLRVAGESQADDMQMYAEPPPPAYADDYAGPRFFPPNNYYAAVPFDLPEGDGEALAQLLAESDDPRVQVQLRLDWRLLPGKLPAEALPIGIQNPTTIPPALPPRVAVGLQNGLLFDVVRINDFPDNVAELPADGLDVDWSQAATIEINGNSARVLGELARFGRFYVTVWGRTNDYAYGVAPGSVRLVVPGVEDFGPFDDAVDPDNARADILLRTHFGSGGQGVRGPGVNGDFMPVGTLAFRGADVDAEGDAVGFELLGDAEQDGSITDYLATAGQAGLRVRAVNVDGRASDWKDVTLDTGIPGYVEFPSDLVATGDFDLQVQTTADDRIVSLSPRGVRLTGAGEPFLWSLAKALVGQWLLSMLVAVIALTLGVFMSWPVALVLSIAILAGRATVRAVGESSGRDAVSEIFDFNEDTSAAARAVVERSYDAINAATITLSRFMPETGAYDLSPLVADREPVPTGSVLRALGNTLAYGLPIFAGGYVVLRRKEVAA